MKRKYGFLRLTVILLLLCLTAAAVAQGAGKPVTITMLQPGLEQPNMKQATQKQIDQFEKENPNIKVELITVGWDQAYDKLVNMFQTKTAPDVIYTGTRWVVPFANMKGILPLNKYFPKSKMQQFPKPLMDSEISGGKIYGVPHAFSSKVLFYRSDWIKEPPKTWNELIETAQKVQKEHPGVYGYGAAGAKHVSTTDQFFNVLFSFGGKVFDRSGKCVLNSPQGERALKLYAGFHLDAKIVPSPLEYNREQLPILFKQGKIAMFECGPWAGRMMGLKPDNTEVPYKMALLPAGTEQHCILNSDSLVVSANSKNPAAAWKLIDYLTTLDVQAEYDRDHGLTPILIEEAKMPEFKDDPYFGIFIKAIDNGLPQPQPAIWEPFQDIIANMVQEAFQGVSPKAALAKAVKLIKEQQLEPRR
ncbi:carbohydrate ABC transporter substrate-binding protein (CUT1 family) [Hydrogenispora ethanolica]|uniref:Carbohydrate ABC transporter substrate-binding protein (CUT1 family) n=1 Tax=Hydrogenispora ethanolica TaxID=1082276 RepID=A0A4R1S6Z5_HYDET|nr:sugar ABC transporter substrate-binding protein [Hydrogenispora ethanolica]TCL75078.1 carbohydrate ABC transporter substrate-binding protein (CUT1 family) [Hydrogenispora ethanolica]